MKTERITEKPMEPSIKKIDVKELREHCITLEESRQAMLDMIYKHSHKK